MNMKQRGWRVEKRKHAVVAKGAQTCTGLQIKRFGTAPYSVVNAISRKFAGNFRHGADVALMQCAHEHKARRMGS